MRRLARAAEAWLWADVAMKVAGLLSVVAVLVLAWAVLRGAAGMLGL